MRRRCHATPGADAVTAYPCTFDRIGRRHDIGEQTFQAEDADHLAELVFHLARRNLASSEVDVVVDLEKGAGHILVGGFRNGGSFSIAALEPAP